MTSTIIINKRRPIKLQEALNGCIFCFMEEHEIANYGHQEMIFDSANLFTVSWTNAEWMTIRGNGADGEDC